MASPLPLSFETDCDKIRPAPPYSEETQRSGRIAPRSMSAASDSRASASDLVAAVEYAAALRCFVDASPGWIGKAVLPRLSDWRARCLRNYAQAASDVRA